jgi:hypothetical protein
MKKQGTKTLVVSKRNSTIYFSLKAIEKNKKLTFLNDMKNVRTYGNFDLPIIEHDGYLKDKTFPLHVIIRKNRFDFYDKWFSKELDREFSFYKRNINNFIDELDLINKKTKFLFENESSFCPLKLKNYYKIYFKGLFVSKYLYKNINFLYKKHKLPIEFVNAINAILFLCTGVWSKKYPLIFASRVVTNVFRGIYKTSESFSAREFLIKKMKNKINYINLESGFNFTKKNNKIELSSPDLEQTNFYDFLAIDEVVEDIDYFEKIYTNVLDYKVRKDLVSDFIGDDILFIDSDKSDWFDYKNLYYIQKLKVEDNYFIFRVVSFLDKKYKINDLKLNKVLLKIFPTISLKDLEVLEESNYNFDDVNYIKYNKKLKKWANSNFNRNLVKIGRKVMPFLGYNAYNKTALKAFSYFFKGAQ